MSERKENSPEPEVNDPEPEAASTESTSQNTARNTDGLSKLSSVLNGLENGALAMRRQVQQAMRAVQAGTYYVDPIRLSRRIVRDCLGAGQMLPDCSF